MSDAVINLNNAQSRNWLMCIHEFEDLAFKGKSFNIPTVTAGVTTLGGSGPRQFVTVGDHYDFDDISYEFHIDEDWMNYQRLFDWIVDNVKKGTPKLRDITIELLDANGHPRGLQLVFENCWPQMLTTVPLDPENADTDLQASVSFKFDDMHFVRRTSSASA